MHTKDYAPRKAKTTNNLKRKEYMTTSSSQANKSTILSKKKKSAIQFIFPLATKPIKFTRGYELIICKRRPVPY